MAKTMTATTIQVHINRLKEFFNYTRAYLIRNNPIKSFITGTITYIKDIAGTNKKLKKIERRIIYEKYKLKKTELILAQNSDHVFLKGKSLNQTR